MKYNVGDKVLIKSIDWYYDNRDRIDEVICGNTNFIPDMVKYCGKIVTISSILPVLKVYHIKEDGGMFNWTDEMFDVFAEEEVERLVDNLLSRYIDEYLLPEGYIFKDENGNVVYAKKIVLEKKKPEYPKTYVECYSVLGYEPDEDVVSCYRGKLIESFVRLLICRDAYWKIAGEEMGLNGPWKPDWTANDNHFYTIHTFNGKIECSATAHRNAVLIFPTEEMRDAFYENFKEEIEQCKELL